MSVSKKCVCCIIKFILSEFLYVNVEIIRVYGQFNNIFNSDLLIKKYLDKFYSIYDLDLFCLNIELILNFDRNLSM